MNHRLPSFLLCQNLERKRCQPYRISWSGLTMHAMASYLCWWCSKGVELMQGSSAVKLRMFLWGKAFSPKKSLVFPSFPPPTPTASSAIPCLLVELCILLLPGSLSDPSIPPNASSKDPSKPGVEVREFITMSCRRGGGGETFPKLPPPFMYWCEDKPRPKPEALLGTATAFAV